MTTRIAFDGAPLTYVGGAWLKLSSYITDCVPVIAGREDLVVTITPGAGQGAPACFIPSRAEIEVDGSLLEVPPETANPRNLSDRNRYPSTWGAVCHEAAHANHSRWLDSIPEETPNDWVVSAMLLEEIRIEARHLRRRFADRRWLRSCALNFVMKDIKDGKKITNIATAAQAAALVLGRVDAQVIDSFDVEAIAQAVDTACGLELVNDMRAIWIEAQDVEDDDAEAMIELGKRWSELVGTPPDENCGWESREGKGQPKEGEGKSGKSDTKDGKGEQKGNQPGDAESADQGDALPDPIAKAISEAVENLAKKVKQQDDKLARDVEGQGIVRMGKPAPARIATAQEQRAAAKLARRIRKVYFQERTESKSSEQLPPGRLRMRQVVSRQAQIAAHGRSNAEPFTRTRRQMTNLPPLRVGIMLDDSNSMGCLTDVMQHVGWVMMHAILAQPDARASTVNISSRARWPIRQEISSVGSPNDDESFTEILQQLTGELQLHNPGNGRLLVVVSDGFYSASERDKVPAMLERLMNSGCRVLWLDCTVEHRGESSAGKEKVKLPSGVSYQRIPYNQVERAIQISFDMLFQSLNQAKTRAARPKGTTKGAELPAEPKAEGE